MPELPEVETVCASLRRHLPGKTVKSAHLHTLKIRNDLDPGMAKKLLRRRIETIARRAKYILIHLDGGDVLVIHLGLTGVIRLKDAGDPGARRKHDHIVVNFTDGSSMVFNDARRFGMAFITPAATLESHPAFAHLGPEPLEKSFTPDGLFTALKKRKTAVKIAIMDQELVVGVGNIYASEALFRAGISPRRSASRVTRTEAAKLHQSIREVLKAAIHAGGSTLRDYRTAEGDLGYFQHQFGVYDRLGKACPGCSCALDRTGGIKRIVQGGRATYYCPCKQS